MKYLEESKKNLISLRTSLIATAVVLTGGIVGIAVADINTILKAFLLIFGIYFEILFITNIMNMNKEIIKNIGVMKDDIK